MTVTYDDKPGDRASTGSRMGGRPWLCPEPRCTPLMNLRDGDYKDIRVPEPGQSFFCWGAMAEPVTFSYDGVEHTNDANGCTYTPLKGLIRFQENAADWNGLASSYRIAGELFAEHRAAKAQESRPMTAPHGLSELELLDLFDRCEAHPAIRQAIRQTLGRAALAANPDAPLDVPCTLCGRAITGAAGDPASHIGCCMADLEDDGASCCRASGLAALRMFGDIYEVNGRDEWHGYDCIYRKTWAMHDDPGDEHDDLRCVKARAALAATPDAPLDVERLARALFATFHARQRCATSLEEAETIAREYAATLDHKEPGSTAG